MPASLCLTGKVLHEHTATNNNANNNNEAMHRFAAPGSLCLSHVCELHYATLKNNK